MKKKLTVAFLVLALMAALAATAQAAAPDAGAKDYTVTYTADGNVESNFKASDLEKLVSVLEPGDSIPVKIKLDNQSKGSVDWYMMNMITESLEDKSDEAAGGAYAYLLTYKDSAGKDRELLNSKRVGGEDLTGKIAAGYPEGLYGVNDALKDYFYLETMPAGKNGTVSLTLTLDGESQGNRYMNTSAGLQMKFAVEPTQSRMIVRVGDDTNRTPYYVAMGASGVILLALAVIGTKRRKEKGGTQE